MTEPRRLRQGSVVNVRSETRAALVRFVLMGAAALVLVAVPTVILFEHIAEDQALRVTVRSAQNLTRRVLVPATEPGLREGSPTSIARLDATVGARMRDGSIARIKVWDLNGKIVYSDEHALMGRSFALDDAVRDLQVDQPGFAEVNQGENAENEFEQNQGDLIQVYTLASTSGGELLIYEAYFPAVIVNQVRDELLIRMAPVGLAALVALSVVQLPLALRLASRVQRSQESRERLLAQTAAAADLERRRVAQELHDDVIQDLAGVGYVLDALHDDITEGSQSLLERSGQVVRRDVGLLRTMVSRLYPPSLQGSSLTEAVDRLGDPLREDGVNVTVTASEESALDSTASALLYRVARESLANVHKHAHATAVGIQLVTSEDEARLVVTDDGVGFVPQTERQAGHYGLALLHDTVTEAGGHLQVESSPGTGSRLSLVLPLA